MELPADSDPYAVFAETYCLAAKDAPSDHTAGVLATANEHNQPTARVVLLKGFDPHGFVFYTNYLGRKGSELAGNPRVCLNFYWPWIGRQVRIDGHARKVSAVESDAYFASRARASQIGAWASKQSEPLDSRETLIERVAELEQLYSGQEIPRPPHWGGYRITPTQIEFWYNGENRLHDRFIFTRTDPGAGWRIIRLNP
ncbi:MAG: pyridoxamine 5'-phosphate oxidase [Candidatus Sumerlaeaceae bacterium]